MTTTGRRQRAAASPGRPPYRRDRARRCSGCGQTPADPIARAEVAMTWLLPVPDATGAAEASGPIERHFCRGCVPTGPVADLACVRCGDGPLLAGDLEAADVGDAWAATMLQAWMTSAGWRLSGPVCPDCVGELAR